MSPCSTPVHASIGIDVDGQPERVRADVCRVGREAAVLLGLGDRWRDELVDVAGDWNAGGYGLADGSTEEAIRLATRTEDFAAFQASSLTRRLWLA